MLDHSSKEVHSSSDTGGSFIIYAEHNTFVQANPNEVVGHIPFLRNGALYPWSELDPGSVHLCVAVMPDCQHLLEKDRITDPPPQQGKVFTVFAPKSFRYEPQCSIFLYPSFLKYIFSGPQSVSTG
jgi:hypothetical protein